MRQAVRAILATSLVILAGCQWPGAPAPQPSPSGTQGGSPQAPDGQAAPASPGNPASFTPWEPDLKAAAQTAKAGASDPGFKVVGGSINVILSNGTQPIAKAVVDLYGPTLSTGLTNDQGTAALSPMEVGTDYQLVIRADGYATVKQDSLEVRQKQTTTVRATLVPGAIVSGRVLAGGQPVSGAVVSDGLNATLSDDQGHYLLTGAKPGTVALRASKSRYKATTRSASLVAGQNGSVDLEMTAAAGTVFLDTRYSGLAADRFKGFQQALADRQWARADAPPGPEGVWILVCPSRALPVDVVAQATNFAAMGGKLILLGEWGGFSGFHLPGANTLAHALGLHFNPDLMRELTAGAPEWLQLTQLSSAAFAQGGPRTVRIFSACSLFGLSTMVPLATTDSKAFRVQAADSVGQVVAMGGPFAAGKAIAIGDSSAWSDDDTDGNGTPNFREADNMLFWEKLLAW